MCIDDGEEFFNNSEVYASECVPLTLGRWRSQLHGNQGFIFQNGNVDLASFDEDGNPVADKKPKFPFEIEFIPNREILRATDSNSRFYKQLVENSKEIKEGEILFTVKARGIDTNTGFFTDYEEIGHIL